MMDKPYGCEICKEAFATPTSLRNHMRTHSETFLFYCQFCPAGFTTKEYLIYHEYTHSSDEPYRCDLCGKTFRQKIQYKTHMLYHNAKNNLDCKVCHKRFETSSDLNDHQQIHCATPYECGLCGDSFSTIKLLETHQIQSHPETNNRFQCSKCPKVFSSSKELRTHMSCHTVHRQHACPECGKFFKTSATLTFHRRSMHNSGQKLDFHCDDCGKIFTSKNKLMIHKVIHRTIKCDICMSLFNNEVDLKWHVDSMHINGNYSRDNSTGSDNDSLSFICRFCKKDFKSKLALSRHEKFHLESHFACDKCDKKFRLEEHLKEHKQSKHGEEKYECFKCGQKFYLKSNLDAHLLTHVTDKPYGCQFCASAFKQADELRSHLLLHNGDKPYFCTLCPSRFKHQAHLSSHLTTLHSSMSGENQERFTMLAQTDSLTEYDSADTEIYMMDTDDESTSTSTGFSKSESFNHLVNPSKIIHKPITKSDEKAPITFLFCGKLEGQKIHKNDIDELSVSDQPQRTDIGNGVQECSDQFEIWDNGISSNTYRPYRKPTNNTKNQNLHGNANYTAMAGHNQIYTATAIPSELPVNNANRQSLDLPRLSNYAGTDNLMSWPSPQHMNLLDQFDSFHEANLSESLGERQLKIERDNVQRFVYKKRLFETSSSENENLTNLNNSREEDIVGFRSQDHITRTEMVPDVVLNNLALKLTRTASKDLAEFNYSSDMLDELLGNSSKMNLEQQSEQVHVNNLNTIQQVQKEAPLGARIIGHGKMMNGFNTRMKNDEIKNQNEVPMCLDKQSLMGRMSELNSIGTGSFQTATLFPKQSEGSFLSVENINSSNNKRKRSYCKWENTSEAEIKFKKKKRIGRYIRADNNVSFFIAKALSGQYSNVDEFSSEENNIGDCTTVADSDSFYGDRGLHDSSCSFLADASTVHDGDDISLNESLLETSNRDAVLVDSSLESDVDTDFESSVEGDNSMTDNCSSLESDDGDEFKVRPPKSHTRECLLKKDRWLKRNFKFKHDKYGTRSCVSYVVHRKNYTDSNKISLKCSRIGKKCEETTNLTEEKIAELRDTIRKKHSLKSVELEINPPSLPIDKSDPLNLNECISPKVFPEEHNFKIATPRYKTRFAQRRIAEKRAILTNNLAERTVVKSNINVKLNTIASPRYKTRYAKIYLLKKAEQMNSEQVGKEKSVLVKTNDPCSKSKNKQTAKLKPATISKCNVPTKKQKKKHKNDKRDTPASTKSKIKKQAKKNKKDLKHDRRETIASNKSETNTQAKKQKKDLKKVGRDKPALTRLRLKHIIEKSKVDNGKKSNTSEIENYEHSVKCFIGRPRKTDNVDVLKTLPNSFMSEVKNSKSLKIHQPECRLKRINESSPTLQQTRTAENTKKTNLGPKTKKNSTVFSPKIAKCRKQNETALVQNKFKRKVDTIDAKIQKTRKISQVKNQNGASKTGTKDMVVIDLTDDEEFPKFTRIKRKGTVSMENHSLNRKNNRANLRVDSDQREINYSKTYEKANENSKNTATKTLKKEQDQNTLTKEVSFTTNNKASTEMVFSPHDENAHAKNHIGDLNNHIEKGAFDLANSMKKNLPYQEDGYLLSIPDFVVPSVENTRLKCKEREKLFHELLGNELFNNEVGNDYNTLKDKGLEDKYRNRGRSRTRGKRKTKRSTSVDSVFSSREKYRKSKQKKVSKRSSSADTVLSKGTKEHKVLKHHKKHSKRSSSADTVLSKASKRHKIPKKCTKRSSSADSILSRGSNIFKNLAKYCSSINKNCKGSEKEKMVPNQPQRTQTKKLSRRKRREICLNIVRRESSEMSTDEQTPNRSVDMETPLDPSGYSELKSRESPNVETRKHHEARKKSGNTSLNNSDNDVMSSLSIENVVPSIGNSFDHFKVDGEICKKLREKVQPAMENFLLKKSLPKHKSACYSHVEKRTEEIWQSILCNQPVINLFRIDEI